MEIVYADRRIVVAVKPAGILSTDEPGGMPELLRSALHTDCIRTVHRLDAQTGGLMVFARSRQAAALLSQQVQQRQFGKEYLAVVHGIPQPAAGQLRDLLRRDPARRITCVADAPLPDTREALLDYTTAASNADGQSLVRIRLHTGRTHQIRVQFASRAMPLVGDRKYGQPEPEDVPLALWACRLTFRHPESEAPMDFTCQPPLSDPWTRFPLPSDRQP